VELIGAQPAERLQPGVLGRIALPAALAARRAHQERLDALCRIAGEGRPQPERLVVRVREDTQQAQRLAHGSLS